MGGEFFDGAGVALVSEAGAVVIRFGDYAGVVEVFLPREVTLREFGRRAGLVEPGGERGKFGGARAFLGVSEAGLGCAKLFGGLALRGQFVGVLKGEERGSGRNAGAFGDRQSFELSGERGSHVDEITLEVALVAGGAGA